MSEELQKPPVLDFDALLRPISDETPSGESLRYSGIYDEINEARRADDVLSMGEWQSDLKVADYRKVIDLATDAIANRSKDVQVAAWLGESMVYRHGFVGLRDSLKLMSSLFDNFWDTVFPEIDEGDMEGRANAVSWLESQTGFAVKKVAITQGNGYSYVDWEDAKRFTLPDNFASLESDQQEVLQAEIARAEREGKVNGDMWKKARSQTRRQFCEELNFTIDECWAELKELNRVIEEKFERNQMPSTGVLNKALDEVHTQVKKILADKRIEEPDPADDEVSEDGGEGSEGRRGSGGGDGTVTGRADALRRLSEIAAYFQRTEPHSPVAYLVNRAVKWGNMPLDTWLQDVIKDESVLGQIKETLGLASGGGYYGGYDSGSESEDPGETSASNDDW